MTITRRILSYVALLGAGFGALAGCVERKITIGSDPSGALVHLNDVEVGHTPVTVPFLWYGNYDVVLTYDENVGTAENPVMQHYYVHTHQRAQVPWFQWLGVDLLAEILPFQFKDEKVWAFTVPPVVEPTNDELLQRAQELKGRLGETVDLQPKKPAAK